MEAVIGLIIIIAFGGAIVWLLWAAFVKSIVWVFEPIAKYVDQKDKERKEFQDAVLHKMDKNAKSTDKRIPLSSRCPVCHKQTMCYDPATDRSVCTECDCRS